jgi:hypothetical protein
VWLNFRHLKEEHVEPVSKGKGQQTKEQRQRCKIEAAKNQEPIQPHLSFQMACTCSVTFLTGDIYRASCQLGLVLISVASDMVH